jgi:hypothetical protein
VAIGTPVQVDVGAATATYTTASFTPPAGNRLFAWIFSRNASAFPTPAISDSAGLTWNQVGGNFDGPASNAFVRARLYWANAGNSAPAMTVTVTSTGNTVGIYLVRVPMGADPIVTNFDDGNSAAGDPAMGPLSGTPAAAIAFAVAQAGATMTQAAGYAVLANTALATNQFRVAASYDLTSPATSVTYTSTNPNSVGVLLELIEAAAGGVTGTLSGVDGADGAAASGGVLVQGTIAATEGPDTASLSGTVPVSGALGATDGADDAAFTGAGSTPAVTGTLDGTDGADTADFTDRRPPRVAKSSRQQSESMPRRMPAVSTAERRPSRADIWRRTGDH